MIKQEGLLNKYQLVAKGIRGNNINDLYNRMESDVLQKTPDVVVIYIGTNDVWQKIVKGTGTNIVEFEKSYRTIIKKMQDNDIKVIVCTPGLIGERKKNGNQQDSDLNLYSDVIRNMAKDLSLPLCDVRKIFVAYIEHNNPKNEEEGILTKDKVHLNVTGNKLVANSLWQVLKMGTHQLIQ